MRMQAFARLFISEPNLASMKAFGLGSFKLIVICVIIHKPNVRPISQTFKIGVQLAQILKW